MRIQKNVIGTICYLGRWALPEEFCWSWGQMIQYNNEFLLKRGEVIHLLRGNTSGQYLTRNFAAAMMQGEWLLMLDSDHSFDPDVVYRMLRIMNRDDLDVLSALYQYKEEPHEFVAYVREGQKYSHVSGFDFTIPNQAIQINSAGAGTLLIRRRAFEKIAAELGERPFDPIGEYGEDFSFFRRLEKVGMRGWLAPNIHTRHLTTKAIDLGDFDKDALTVSKSVNIPVMR